LRRISHLSYSYHTSCQDHLSWSCCTNNTGAKHKLWCPSVRNFLLPPVYCFPRRYKYPPQDSFSNFLFFLQGYRTRFKLVKNNRWNYNFAHFKIMFLDKLRQARLR